MSTIQDEIFRVTGEQQLNDGLLVWFKAQGATSDDLQDAERELLLSKGGFTGTNQDLWFAWLRSLAFTGSLPDMKLAFWTAEPAL